MPTSPLLYSLPPAFHRYLLTGGLAPSSSYVASKHAAEGFSASLRMELRSCGIHVVTMNPSFHRTPLVAAGVPRIKAAWDNLSDAKREEYGEAFATAIIDSAANMLSKFEWEPQHVTAAVVEAVCAWNPRTQYLLGMDAKFVFPIVRQLPAWLGERLNLFQNFKTVPPAAFTYAGMD